LCQRRLIFKKLEIPHVHSPHTDRSTVESRIGATELAERGVTLAHCKVLLLFRRNAVSIKLAFCCICSSASVNKVPRRSNRAVSRVEPCFFSVHQLVRLHQWLKRTLSIARRHRRWSGTSLRWNNYQEVLDAFFCPLVRPETVLTDHILSSRFGRRAFDKTAGSGFLLTFWQFCSVLCCEKSNLCSR